MAVITLTEAKVLLQITGTTQDALITALIPIIEDEIREYTNQNWQDAPDTPSWQAWMKLPVSRMIGYNLNKNAGNGLQSESIGTYSYTKAAMSGAYPTEIMKAFDKVKVTRIIESKKRQQYREMRGLDEWQIVQNYEPRGNVNEEWDADELL
jgi:hypothetical protein